MNDEIHEPSKALGLCASNDDSNTVENLSQERQKDIPKQSEDGNPTDLLETFQKQNGLQPKIGLEKICLPTDGEFQTGKIQKTINQKGVFWIFAKRKRLKISANRSRQSRVEV